MHKIQKLTLEINAPTQQKGEEILADISHFLQTELLPILEAHFDALDYGNTIHRIEKLSLDLGTVRVEDFPRNMLYHVKQQAAEKLEEELRRGNVGKRQLAVEGGQDNFDSQKVSHSVNHLAVAKPPIQISPSQGLLDTFTYFVKYGTLPWWANNGGSVRQLEQDLTDQLKEGKQRQLITDIQALIKENHRHLKRLVYQFSEAFLSLIFYRIAPAQKMAIELLHKVLVSAVFPVFIEENIPESLINNLLWQATFEEFLSASSGMGKEAVVQKFMEEVLKNRKGEVVENLVMKLRKRMEGETIEGLIKQTVLQIVESIETKKGKNLKNKALEPSTKEEQDKGLRDNDHTERKPASVGIISQKTENEIIRPNTQKVTTNESSVIPRANEFARTVYLPHAGIVLLHAMLPPFFQRLGLVKHNNFISEKARKQAVYLLHYLCTEEENPSEDKLLLYKLLCNFPLDEVLPPPHPFTQATKDECQNMLTAAISYWKIMPNTSPRSLRGAFLQRPGKLSRQGNDGKHFRSPQFQLGNGWLLQLESAPHDIILDFAPWGLGLVRFGWMEEVLLVEWGR